MAEHHQNYDGYISCPLIFAAAVGGRTRRVKMRTGVVLAPLYDPVRLAEEAAVAGVAVVSTVPRRDDNHCMPALGPNAEVDKCLHLAAAPSTYQGDRLRRAAE